MMPSRREISASTRETATNKEKDMDMENVTSLMEMFTKGNTSMVDVMDTASTDSRAGGMF